MKPTLFNTQMVRAILALKKSQTRRVIKPQPREKEIIDPPFSIGDILWVREAFSDDHGIQELIYKADEIGISEKYNMITWKPSIHMPKEYSRILLKVIDARVEKIQDISEEDAIAEGCHADEKCISTY